MSHCAPIYTYTVSVFAHTIGDRVVHDVEIDGCKNVAAIGRPPVKYERKLVREIRRSTAHYKNPRDICQYFHWKFQPCRHVFERFSAGRFPNLWARLEWIESVIGAEMTYNFEIGKTSASCQSYDEYYMSSPTAGYGPAGGWVEDWRERDARYDPRRELNWRIGPSATNWRVKESATALMV